MKLDASHGVAARGADGAPIYAVQTDPRQRRRTTLSSTRRMTAPSVAATKLAAVDTGKMPSPDERPEDADHDVADETEAMPSEERH